MTETVTERKCPDCGHSSIPLEEIPGYYWCEGCREYRDIGADKPPSAGSNYQSTAAIQTTEEANELAGLVMARAITDEVLEKAIENSQAALKRRALSDHHWYNGHEYAALQIWKGIDEQIRRITTASEGAGGERSAEEGGTTDARSGRLNV